MTNLEKLITSEYLYPLWRIGWIEKAFFLACRRFGKQQTAKLFDNNTIGFDISYYQGAVDFNRMRANGGKFVIIRCGYRTVEDSMFDTYMDAVNGILPRNVYHFYDPAYPPLAQANAIIESLAWHDNIGRVWLDFEFDWGGSYSGSNNWLIYRNALNAAGYKTGIYTRATWWDSRVGTLAAEFGRDPLWAAQYSTTLTLIPKGWTKAMIWQSGSPTYDAGQTSPRIDYDLWNTDYDFTAEWGSSSPPPPNGATTMYTGTAKTTATPNVRLRQANADGSPNPSGTTIGAIQPGQSFKGDLISGSWMRVTEIGSKTVQALTGKPYGFSALQYLNYEMVTVPPPPPPPPAEIVKELKMQLATGSVVTYTENGVEKWKVTA